MLETLPDKRQATSKQALSHAASLGEDITLTRRYYLFGAEFEVIS